MGSSRATSWRASSLPSREPEVDFTPYWRNGFQLFSGLYSPEELDRYEKRFLDLVLGHARAPEETVVMRDIMVVKGDVEPKSQVHAVNKLMNFESDPVLFEYSTHPALLSLVRSLIGPELMTLSTNVFNKPPGVDGRHPLHQDLRYFKLRPASGIVASWTAISPTTRDNGCLVVLPKSHERGLLEHDHPGWERVNSGFFGATEVDRSERVHIEMNPGDTLLFHPLLLHGSGRNRTADFRRAISTHYASVDCQRPDEPRKREPMTRRIESA